MFSEEVEKMYALTLDVNKTEYFTRKAPVLRGGAPVAIRRRAPLNFNLIAVKLGNI